MDATEALTLEAVAESVRRDCIDIMSRCAIGQSMEACKLAAVLCLRAAGILQQEEMAREGGRWTVFLPTSPTPTSWI